MSYLVGEDREQYEFSCLDMWVAEDSIVRLIDAFVLKAVISSGKFKENLVMGRPSYSPRHLMNLYIYGYANKIKSSRQLAKACKTNIEVMWLMEGLRPDFRTISDFRKNNKEAITSVLKLFENFCKEVINKECSSDLFVGSEFFSVDGTKIRAVQSKDGCFSANKIDDRIKNDKARIAQMESYLKEMDKVDGEEEEEGNVLANTSLSKGEVEKRLDNYLERLEKHEKIRGEIEKSGTQYSEYDPDARLMKNHYGGCNPSYNVQTSVDNKHHLITSIDATNKCTDHGLLNSAADKINEGNEGERIIELVADSGYEDVDDIATCLENGVVPHVILRKESNGEGAKRSVDISYPYEPERISDEKKASLNKEDIKDCLRAGVVPDCYEKYLEVSDKNFKYEYEYEYRDEDEFGIDKMSDEEKRNLALQGYFVRDLVADKVFCPAGEILRRKSKKKNECIRYCNKLACKNCKMKCYSESKTTRWKEIDFGPYVRIKGDGYKNRKGKKIVGRKQRVVFKFTSDLNKTKERKCLSEHPFGTIKRYMLGDHFLLRGLDKVKAECALLALGYNLKRVSNLISIPDLIRAIG